MSPFFFFFFLFLPVLCEVTRVGDLLVGILRKFLSVPAPELRRLRSGIFSPAGSRPFELEDEVIVPETLKLIHGLGGVLVVHKGDEGETSRLHLKEFVKRE